MKRRNFKELYKSSRHKLGICGVNLDKDVPQLTMGYVPINPSLVENIINQNAFSGPNLSNISLRLASLKVLRTFSLTYSEQSS